MSFSEEFKTQWQSLTDYIVSDMVKNSASRGSVDYDSICNIYKNEALRWSMQGQYNAEWYNSLHEADQEVAEKFLAKLNSFKFTRVTSKKASPGINLIGAGAGAAAGVGISWLIKFSVLPLVAVGIGAAVIGGIAGTKLSDSKNEKAVNTEITEYSRQLNEWGAALTDIVRAADKE